MSKIDTIRISLQQYDESVTVYTDTMEQVDSGEISLGAIADADEGRCDGALDFVDDAADFIRTILPHIDAIRVALSADAGNHGERTRDAARRLINAVTAKPDPSHGGTDKE